MELRAALLGHIPFYFGSTPQKHYADQEVEGDWCYVAVNKLGSNGKPLPFTAVYLMENSTGDLYGMQDPKGPPSRLITSIKCALVAAGVIPYALAMAAWRPFNFIADLAQIALSSAARLSSDWPRKGALASLTECAAKSCLLTASSLAENISCLVATFFYAPVLFLAALYGVVIPFEGMKNISAIEGVWHQGVGYQADFRYGKGGSCCPPPSPLEVVRMALAGKVCFLGYCFQKRGNIGDMVREKRRFALTSFPSNMTCKKNSN